MKQPLFWVDLEMTGLDEKVDTILEVAIVITDMEFKPLEAVDPGTFAEPK